MNMMLQNKIAPVALVLAMAIPIPGLAVELDYEIRAGAASSDNVARTETAEIEETIALAGLVLDLQHESRKVTLDVNTDLEYRNYTDDTFDDEVVGALNAELVAKLVPDVLSWVFLEQFGNLQNNPFEADTPLNRQNVNRFSTGPDLRLRMGSVTNVDIGGRYTSNNFEEGNIDSNVLNGRISVVRDLSPRRSLSFNISADRIEFDDNIDNRDYDRQAVFLGFQSEISRGTLNLDLGYNEIHDNGESFDGSLIAVEWTRDISASTLFRLSYDQRLSDAGDAIGANQAPGLGFGDVQQTPPVSDPFTNRQFSSGVDFSRDGKRLFVSVSYTDDEYVTRTELDRSWADLRAGASWTLGSAWLVRIEGRIQKTKFNATEREDDDISFGAGLSRQLSRTIRINLDFARNDRDSSEPLFSYVENVAFLTFSYAR